MDWADEHYVKLYTRDTPQWKALPWQGKMLLPALLRKLDGAGLLEIGRMTPTQAVAVMVEAPLDFVDPGLKALLETGVLELVERGVAMPNYIAAQEARKTDRLRKRDERQRRLDKARSQPTVTPIPDVTRSHTLSQGVTPRHPPSPALPVPDPVPKQHVEQNARPSVAEEVFEHWKAETKKLKSKFDTKRQRLIEARLKDYDADTLKKAISGYLKSPFHTGQNNDGKKHLGLNLILRDAEHIEDGLEFLSSPPRPPPKLGIVEATRGTGPIIATRGF